MSWEKLKCKCCQQSFENPDELHQHIKQSHQLKLTDYYKTYWPRKNILTGNLIQFKTFDNYFDTFYDNKTQLNDWYLSAQQQEKEKVLLEILETRIKRKKLEFAPCEAELISQKMPSKRYYIETFGSYEAACSKLGVEPIFFDSYIRKPVKQANPLILIDTREQKPLKFNNSQIQKLSIGDYCLGGEETYTFVDRKSSDDFKGTMTQGYERFCREIERASLLGCYLIVLIESTPEKIKKEAIFQRHDQAQPEYAFKNMRDLIHKYPRNIQFVFQGDRKTSEFILPYILLQGESLWNYDIQYHLEKKNLIK